MQAGDGFTNFEDTRIFFCTLGAHVGGEWM